MACISALQTTCCQVERTEEEGGKYAGLIVVTGISVEGSYDVGRIAFSAHQFSQVSVNIGHEHGGGGSLATGVTYAKIQFPVNDTVVEQVAPPSDGRVSVCRRPLC